MIIRSSKSLKKYGTHKDEQVPAIVKTETKVTNDEIIRKKKNKKNTSITEEKIEVIVEEEKIDLSEWLKEEE